MEQPPANDAPSVDRDVWIACAAPGFRLPTVGSQVFYFTHGHAEQCSAPLPAPLSQSSVFPCTVHAVELFADAKTDEPYATIALTPGPHGDHPENANPTPDTQADTGFRYCVKQLTQIDANHSAGFTVPRTVAETIFPTLDLQDDLPLQNLRMRDLCGNHWPFRHIYRGTPRRHFFTTGWTKFVDDKLLVAGDTVVFIRRPNGDLLVGVRRAPRYPMSQKSGEPPRSSWARVQPQEVIDSVRDAANGDMFTVTYYPRQGAGEFVVPRKEVENALKGAWMPGMHVLIQGGAIDAEERRFERINGVVKAVGSSSWRMLEVEWHVTESRTKINRHVNPWQIRLVAFPPLPEATQETRRTVLADVPSSSSTTELDTNASSVEVNQLPNAVVDGTAPNEDASAPSPLDCCGNEDAMLSESEN